jgi:hypothetical protein
VRITMVLLGLALSGCGPDAGKGTGTGDGSAPLPDLEVTPSEVRFPQASSREPVVVALTVANVGLGALTITGLIADLPASIDADLPGTPLVIDPGASVQLPFTYTPTEAEETGSLVLSSDDPGAPRLTFGVVGEGLVPGRLELPDSVDLGITRPRCPVAAELVVSNPGALPVTLERVVALPAEVMPTLVDRVVPPGGSAVVPISWTPETLDPFSGELQLETDVGDFLLPLQGVVDASVPGRCETVRLANRVERLDLALVVDGTTLGTPRREALAAVLDDVLATVKLAVPDFTVGLAVYADYGHSRPWTLLQQQTDSWPAMAPLLDGVVPADSPLAVGFDAMVQAGDGYGYDARCDGVYDDDDSSPFRVDLFFGGEQLTYDPTVSGTGPGRGMGMRNETTALLMVLAGAPIRSPVAGDPSPGGCPLDADLQDVFDTWSYSGVRFVGVGDDPLLPLVAAELLSFLDLDDDGRYDELAVVPPSADPDTLADTLTDVLLRSVAGRPNITLTLSATADVPVVLSPTIARGLLAGEEVAVDVIAEAGTFVDAPGTDTVTVTITAREDARIVGTRELYLQP